jgi:hypothetical protein
MLPVGTMGPSSTTEIFMKHAHSSLRRTAIIASLAWLTLLAGCGAGVTSQPEEADASVYSDTLAYCSSQGPADPQAQAGSWILGSPAHTGAPVYELSAIALQSGTPSPTIPVHLQVDIHDFRGLTGSFTLPGYAAPQWKMGVNLAPPLPARAAACVVSLAKLSLVPSISAENVVGHANWSSKWSNKVPFAGLSGQVVDGFEFVGDFVPTNASAFFFVPKSWVANAQNLSICYRAPTADSWDCAAPNVTDAGSEWGVSRSDAKPGVYVVTAPSPD